MENTNFEIKKLLAVNEVLLKIVSNNNLEIDRLIAQAAKTNQQGSSKEEIQAKLARGKELQNKLKEANIELNTPERTFEETRIPMKDMTIQTARTVEEELNPNNGNTLDEFTTNIPSLED